MSRNALRNKNNLKLRHISLLLGIAFLVSVFVFFFVLLRMRIIEEADAIKKMEVTLQEVIERNSRLQVSIEQAKSPAQLQAQVRHFRLDMVDLRAAGLDIREGPRALTRREQTALRGEGP